MAGKQSVKLDEDKLLTALQRYYIEDISFERVAEEAGITVYELIEYVRKHDLPIIHTDEDVADGLKKVEELREKYSKKVLAK